MSKQTSSFIFLDIDGVIWSRQFGQSNPNRRYLDNDPRPMRMIGRLAAETSSKIIISSSWRTIYETLDELKGDLAKSGAESDLLDPIIDWTPKLEQSRGREIAAWLFEHSGQVEHYVILDDAKRRNFLKSQRQYLVKTHIDTGFKSKHFRKAKRILNGEVTESAASGSAIPSS
jgi:hypothetical protein